MNLMGNLAFKSTVLLLFSPSTMRLAGHMCWQWRRGTRSPWLLASFTLTCLLPLSPSEWWMKTKVPTSSPTPNSLNWKREWCLSQHWPFSPRRTPIASRGKKSRMLLVFVLPRNLPANVRTKKGYMNALFPRISAQIAPCNCFYHHLSPQLCGHEREYQSANRPREKSASLLIPHFVLQTTDNNKLVLSSQWGASKKLK